MRIFTRAESGLLPPRRELTAMDWPDGWIVHYVGATGMRVAPTFEQSAATVRSIQADAFANVKQGYIDIQYNFLVDPLGRIFEGRGWQFKSAANGSSNYNAHAWAVCYLGGPDTPLTTEARGALLWLTQEGARRVAAVSYVKPHGEVYATACPGDLVRPFCRTLQVHLHDDPTEVLPVYSPATTISNIVHSLAIPTGGAWLLSADGTVVAAGRSGTKMPVGGPKGHDYWIGRTAARLEPYGDDGYAVIATSGERYLFP